MYFVYLLKSQLNGKSYIGVTSKEVDKRLQEHNFGSNIWTSRNKPFRLVYYESYFKSGIGKKLKKLLLKNYGD